jgi:hypothetical protein
MGSAARSHTAPHPRAVTDAPVDALVARADELARRWAIALILALPLERLGELPLETFAREAPSLCADVARALSSDEQLARICAADALETAAPPPARRLAEMTGARDSTAVVEVVEALRGVLWDAVRDEVSCHSADRHSARDMAELGDRLAYVCSSAMACSLAAQPPLSARRSVAQRAGNGAPATATRDADLTPAHDTGVMSARGAGLTPARSSSPARRAPLADGVALIDEAPAPLRRRPPPVERPPAWRIAERAAASPVSPPEQRASRVRARPLPWDPPLRPEPRPADEPA